MIIYRLFSHSKLKQLRSTRRIFPKIGKHMKSNNTISCEDVSTHVQGCQNASHCQHNSSICNNKKPGDGICRIVYLQAGAFLAAACLVVGDRVTDWGFWEGGQLPKLTKRFRLAPLLGVTGELNSSWAVGELDNGRTKNRSINQSINKSLYLSVTVFI